MGFTPLLGLKPGHGCDQQHASRVSAASLTVAIVTRVATLKVRAGFGRVVGFREAHNAPNDTSDLYVVCALVLEGACAGAGADGSGGRGATLPTLVIDPKEIAEAKWLYIALSLSIRSTDPAQHTLSVSSVPSILRNVLEPSDAPFPEGLLSGRGFVLQSTHSTRIILRVLRCKSS